MTKKLISAIFLAGLAASPLSAAADLSQINVYPNPVRRAIGQTTLTFDNVTPDLRVRIFTATGVLVLETQVSGGGNSFVWDLKNSGGNEVASGVYVYVLTNSAREKKTGKIAVIR